MVIVSRGALLDLILGYFKNISPQDLQTANFEIILTLEGTTPETGNNIQVSIS